jgi:hypothetical protein
MLSPKVIELRRGSAHCGALRGAKAASSHGAELRLVKPAAGPVQRSEVRQPWNSVHAGHHFGIARAA